MVANDSTRFAASFRARRVRC